MDNNFFLGKSSSKLTESKVKLYVPDQNSFQNFMVKPIDDCGDFVSNDSNFPDDNLADPESANEYYGCYSGGSPVANNIGTPDTSNYNVCVNSEAGWIDNIFGKSYVCEYKFNSDHKLRTIFEANDFYFFQDVYAQAKFKQKTWLGWFSDRSADEVYLLNKKVILNTKRKNRGFDLSINLKDVKKIYNDVYNFFLSNPSKKLAYISNEYDFNNKNIKTFSPILDNLLVNATTNLNLYKPTLTINKPLVDIDFNLKNFFGKKINKAISINILGLTYNLSNSDIIKLSYEALSKTNIDLEKGETGGIVFTYQDPKTLEIRPVAYSIFGEKITVNKLAVASRNFDVPQNLKIDDFSLLFKSKTDNSTNTTNSYIGLRFKFSIDIVNSVDIEIESGAYYKGIWGGSKFKVQY